MLKKSGTQQDLIIFDMYFVPDFYLACMRNLAKSCVQSSQNSPKWLNLVPQMVELSFVAKIQTKRFPNEQKFLKALGFSESQRNPVHNNI